MFSAPRFLSGKHSGTRISYRCKLHDVIVIRKTFLAVDNAFIDALSLPEPFISTRTSKELLSILTTVHKTIEKVFNKAIVKLNDRIGG
jgi:hypothetical protein